MLDFFSMGGCLLCDEVNNEGSLSSRLGRYQRPSDRILLETAHFLFIPDISPIVPGHSLLVTKDHLTCFAHIPENLAREAQSALRRAAALIEGRYSAPLLFEHGTATPSMAHSGACIQHAHIHFLPVRVPVETSMQKFGDLTNLKSSLPSTGTGFDLAEDYLWYRDQEGKGSIVQRLKRPVPCQFIRRVIAETYKLPRWNWESMLEVPPRESPVH